MREVNYDERWKAARDLSCKINLWPTVENLQHIDAALRRAKAEVLQLAIDKVGEMYDFERMRHSGSTYDRINVLQSVVLMLKALPATWPPPDARAAQIEEGAK